MALKQRPEGCLTRNEAAKHLRMSVSWFAHLRATGRGPQPINRPDPGHALLFKVADLDEGRDEQIKDATRRAEQRFTGAEVTA